MGDTLQLHFIVKFRKELSALAQNNFDTFYQTEERKRSPLSCGLQQTNIQLHPLHISLWIQKSLTFSFFANAIKHLISYT